MKLSYIPRNIAILGLGKTGLSVARFFASIYEIAGCNVFCIDDNDEKFYSSREIFQNSRNVKFVKNVPWEKIDVLVVSPGVVSKRDKHPSFSCALRGGAAIMSDIELFLRMFSYVKMAGITGTNGKSTTCALVKRALCNAGIAAEVVGNFGCPIFDFADEDHLRGVYILEISSYQLLLTNFLPLEVAAITNISSHHIDAHGTLGEYIAAKKKIFFQAKRAVVGDLIDGQKDIEVFFQNQDGACGSRNSSKFHEFAGPRKCKVVYVSERSEADFCYCASGIFEKGRSAKYVLPENEWFSRSHNIQNAAIAIAVCRSLGVEDVCFDGFFGLEHRQEIVGSCKEVVYVNDSKATSPEAVKSAVLAFSRDYDIFWIGGGVVQDDSLAPISDIARYVKKAFFIGEAADRYAHIASSSGILYEKSGDIETALCSAQYECESRVMKGASVRDSLVLKKAVILFSPGCASFDQFKNFEHRGDVFKKLIANRFECDKR
ncbi:UDP-N-acetylmuramoyl-L-alanine--D-glutamate ligase [Candidatus Hydrogenosomobacter endosymbioticus]|uniref:UDP-N-acetylmuramoylalanine--D-glutamate ligase n=1 Tax=Candidatus Hydrogenosomobacter endosymbioticus TaxID=2558174 RepID=A0ABN6L3B0_9PROT|nr:UDP-N-acetylmuramoyl-L-alanine--D-glutamate ligase [Candidatus Hydrogenosomobacter endosymbioticus]BDB96363.1 UDP-N-acetylmuramoylalanine--D-glutamate ligase [Candidatus Hydrogenosomobacter endosymbioticus]